MGGRPGHTPVTKQQMAEAVGMDPQGGGFNNYISTLKPWPTGA